VASNALSSDDTQAHVHVRPDNPQIVPFYDDLTFLFLPRASTPKTPLPSKTKVPGSGTGVELDKTNE
jgi:hypothetical protein